MRAEDPAGAEAAVYRAVAEREVASVRPIRRTSPARQDRAWRRPARPFGTGSLGAASHTTSVGVCDWGR